MSHGVEIDPIVFALSELIGAIADLHLARREVQQMRTSSGQTHDVDFVVDGPSQRQIGFKKQADGHYQPIVDSDGLTDAQKKEQLKTVNQIVQRYSYRTVVKELQAKGYTIAKEERQPDNSIRLVLNKWG